MKIIGDIESGEMKLPTWLISLEPDFITDSGESWCCHWVENDILLDIYPDDEVVVIAPCEGGKRGYCEVTINDRQWIEDFVKHGWSDNNPSFKK